MSARIALAVLAIAGTAAAATPATGSLTDTSGAVSYSAGPFFVSNVTAQAAGTPVCSAATPCDDFALTVNLPADWATTHPTDQVVVRVAWTNPVADFDVYILDAKGALVTKAASSDDPEVAQVSARGGTNTYTIRTAPFTVAGDSFSATVSLVTPTPPPSTPPVAIDPGSAPRFHNFAAPNGLGTSSGEPSIGVNWKTGNVIFLAGTETLKVQFDDSTSPARANWSDVSSQFTSVISLDPIGFTDPRTGRTVISQLVSGLGYGVGCSLTAYSDDDGMSWTPSEGCGTPAGADHQTVGGGPYPKSAVVTDPVYPNAVYYCSQAQATALCARSDDGGLTFGAGVPLYNLTQCGGLHGHVKVGPDGTAYVPNRSCGGKPAVVVSEDGGLTWDIRAVPTSAAGHSDPSVGIGANGTVYVGYDSADGHAHLAISRDRGRTWQTDADVGSLFGVQNTAFPAVVAGDDDRAAFTFLGTGIPGDFQAATFPGVWHLYSIQTYDGGKSFTGADATPNDPVQRGCIWLQGGSNQCRNLLDFTGAEIDAHGRVLVGYADGCTGACVNAPPNTYGALATIARQSGGRPLFSRYDPPAPAAPAAPLLSGVRDSSGVQLSWPAPDDGGSAITSYRIYRGATSGSETFLAQVTKNAFTDAVTGPTPYYRVSAVNSVGESALSNEMQPANAPPPIVYDPCTTPGQLIASDPTGDQTGAPADPQADLTSLSIAEPLYLDGTSKLVFTLRVAGSLNPLPPNIAWKVYFTTPDNTPRYISMDTFQPTGPRYQFGHTQPGAGGVSQNVNDGPIDPASNSTADGRITLIVDETKIGSPQPGQTIAGVRATTQILVGATAGLLATADQTGTGSYTLVGRAACENRAPVAALTATPTSGYTPLAVSFDGTASTDPDAGDSVATYAFDFGDGTSTTQAGAFVSHTYTAAGSYTASLAVTDTHGKTSASAATTTIVVTDPPPPQPSEISGSGFLAGGPKFNLDVLSNLTGHFKYDDDVGAMHWKKATFSAYSRSGKCVTFSGTATSSDTGQALQFMATACDNGDPGRNADTLSISVGSAYTRSGTLQGGNLTLH